MSTATRTSEERSDRDSDREVVAIEPKGRNAGMALERELSEDVEEVKDILNGKGKQAAKQGTNWPEVKEEVEDRDYVELRDTGRRNERPHFTQKEEESKTIVSYEESPFEVELGDKQVEPDRTYAAYDELVEWGLQEEITGFETLEDFNGIMDFAIEVAGMEGYDIRDENGEGVQWAAMANSSLEEVDTVLYDEGFELLSKELAQKYWGTQNLDFATYEEFANEQEIGSGEEEEILSEAGNDVGGIYMTVTGSTAEEYALNFDPIDGAISKQGHFKKTSN